MGSWDHVDFFYKIFIKSSTDPADMILRLNYQPITGFKKLSVSVSLSIRYAIQHREQDDRCGYFLVIFFIIWGKTGQIK